MLLYLGKRSTLDHFSFIHHSTIVIIVLIVYVEL